MVPCDGRDVRDDPPATEQDLRQVLIDMIPIPGQAHAEGGELMRNLLAEFLRGFSLRTLIFLLDMVLPQLDAYRGRQLQHLQPWTSVVLAQRQGRGQPGVELVRYGYEAFAGFHVVQLLTDGIPLLLFSDPKAVPSVSPFFFPPVWPIRTRLGPYNCVSSEKQECTRTRVVQKLRQIITKQRQTNNKKPPQPKTTRKSPSQICVSPQSKTAKQQGTG